MFQDGARERGFKLHLLEKNKARNKDSSSALSALPSTILTKNGEGNLCHTASQSATLGLTTQLKQCHWKKNSLKCNSFSKTAISAKSCKPLSQSLKWLMEKAESFKNTKTGVRFGIACTPCMQTKNGHRRNVCFVSTHVLPSHNFFKKVFLNMEYKQCFLP